MKKIITAINNPKLNEELKKEKNFEVIGKDIQYREAILEVLEKNECIDLIIISEEISGEIKIEKLIEKIKIKNEKIKIIFILEKENNNLEKILIKNNIIDIYYNNKINLNELIKIINKKEINIEEEIIKLRKIIEEKNINNNNQNISHIKKYKEERIEKHLKKIKSRIDHKRNKSKKIKNEKGSSQVITFSGNFKSGKSTMALIISQYLSQKNYKVLLIDGDLEKQDLTTIIKSKHQKNKKHVIEKRNKEKIKKRKIKEMKLIDKKDKIHLLKVRKVINLFIIKINKNFYFYYNFKSLLRNKKIKKIIFDFFKIVKQNYDFIIIDLSKLNSNKINKEILKNSSINFICMESNLLGLKEIQRLLDVYLKKWNLKNKSLYIIENKKNFSSMNTNFISRSIPIKNPILSIKENKVYNILLNYYFKRNIIFKNKSIKKQLNKIINKIIFK